MVYFQGQHAILQSVPSRHIHTLSVYSPWCSKRNDVFSSLVDHVVTTQAIRGNRLVTADVNAVSERFWRVSVFNVLQESIPTILKRNQKVFLIPIDDHVVGRQDTMR